MTKNFNKLTKKRQKSGFTVLELMITIFVIAVALVGGMTALQKTATLTSASSDKLIAAYLTQEGLEIIRNIRDGNWLDSDPSWNYGFDNCETGCTGCTGCIVDYSIFGNEGSWQIPFSEQKLTIDSANGYYYGGPTETKFKRKITIKPDPADPDNNILNVLVEVTWQERGEQKSFSAQENLYNWKR